MPRAGERMQKLIATTLAVLALLAWAPAHAPAEEGDSFVIGMFVYMADAARLSECRTGRSLPVAMAGDYQALERAYLGARTAPGQPLLATFDGAIEERPRLEGSGTEPTAVVRRFINVWPGETCERNLADAALTNTYWRIVRLGGETVGPVEGHREPHLLLSTEERFRATVGCNQMVGGYHLDGQALQFGAAASTMMACPPPLDGLERRLAETLERTARWRINAQFLELEDSDGKAIALLRSVYLH